ncbi:MAG: NnrU family protein [Calditrichia bacterium]
MKRSLIFIYGVLGYLFFFGTFLYWIGFVGNFWVPKSVDSGQSASLLGALAVDLGLISLFGLQHSIMARRSFKRWLTGFMPKSMVRSTYVIASSAVLVILFWQWQPLNPAVWNIENPAGQMVMNALFALGWLILLVSTYLINHFELFGLQQVYTQLKNQPFEPPHFQTPLFYRIIRHPMMVGIIIAMWATPFMSAGHILFAWGLTGYILAGVWFEERDLVKSFGRKYQIYQSEVPKIIPRLRRRESPRQPAESN